MLALIATALLAAAPSPRLSYETKCLYCHSEEVTEHTKLTPTAWKKVIERMRSKAPLLISRADVAVLTRYLTQTLKLVPPPARAPRPTEVATPVPAPIAPVPAPRPEPVAIAAEPEPEPEPEAPQPSISPDEVASQQAAFTLMQQRCSKCHTLGRVYAKLDSFERSMAVLERMRLKTGSGITDHDLGVLEEYLRAQF